MTKDALGSCARRTWDFGNHDRASRTSRADIGRNVRCRRGHAVAHGCRIARQCACSGRVRGVFVFSRSVGCGRGKSRRCKRFSRDGPSDLLGCVGDGAYCRNWENVRHGCLKTGRPLRLCALKAAIEVIPRHVRFWHKADMLVALHMSAIEGKADIALGMTGGNGRRTHLGGVGHADGPVQLIQILGGALGDFFGTQIGASQPAHGR